MHTKLKTLLSMAALAIFFSGCIKNNSDKTSSPTSSLIETARAYFNMSISASSASPNRGNYRACQPKSVDWASAITQHLPSYDAIIAPVTYNKNLLVTSTSNPNVAFNLSNLTSLVLIRDSNKVFHTAMLTLIPDSTNTTTSPSGVFLQEDWYGNSLAKPVRFGPSSTKSNSSVETDVIQNIQVCNEIDGYNYSPDDPSGGIAWSETSCTTYGFEAGTIGPGRPLPGLTGLPIPRLTPLLEVVLQSPQTRIADIAAYFGCFTNGPSPDHSYSVQVCVDQPEDGTRQAWGLTPGGLAGSSAAGNLIDAGHTFLVLTENNQGNIITRSVGFYPATSVGPGSSVQGVLGNDQAHDYNISVTFNVSSAQFFNILNYVELGNNPGYDYNLSTNNCSTFAIHAVATGGITLPATLGTWPGGSGNDPGDLGEDIRAMGSPNVNTVENPHPNTGICN
jgi:hypothetical protein